MWKLMSLSVVLASVFTTSAENAAETSTAAPYDEITKYSGLILNILEVIRSPSTYNTMKEHLQESDCVFMGCREEKLRQLENVMVRTLVLGVFEPSLFSDSPPAEVIRGLASELALGMRNNATDDTKAYIGRGWFMDNGVLDVMVNATRALNVSKAPIKPFSNDSTVTNSSFAEELLKRQDAGWNYLMVGEIAGFVRCAADHLDEILVKPGSKQSHRKIRAIRGHFILNEVPSNSTDVFGVKWDVLRHYCGGWYWWVSLYVYEAEGQFAVNEFLENLNSEDNALDVLNDVAVLTTSLKASSSYDSGSAFLRSLNESRRLTARALAVKEVFNCRYKQVNPRTKNFMRLELRIIEHIARYTLPMNSNATEDGLAALIRSAVRTFEEFFNMDFVGTYDQWLECLVPPEARKYSGRIIAATNGSDKDRRQFLEEIKLREPLLHALCSFFFEEVKILTRRYGLGSEAKQFLQKAIIYIVEVALGRSGKAFKRARTFGDVFAAVGRVFFGLKKSNPR